ncbi:MAG: energy transducer TonB [candidate division KSB1 bacterium]|nr:energy transducer TonB [candidate division KSB1 bacterium]
MKQQSAILLIVCVVFLIASCQGEQANEARMMEVDGSSQNVPPKETSEAFVPYDTPPQPEGGFAELQRRVAYPEIARKAGIEGKVLLQVKIDESGDVVDHKIVESLGNNGCDEAALNAVRSVKWVPAKQGDKSIAVWVAIPIVFKLDGGQGKTHGKMK